MNILDWELPFAQAPILFDLQNHRLHSEKVEELLDAEVVNLKQKYEELRKDCESYEKFQFFEEAYEQYLEISEVYPQIQRKSELICIYSVLENSLNNLCALFQSVNKSPLKLRDLGEKDIIKRAKVYLTKVMTVQFPEDHSSWKEVTMIQKIRNKFVHEEGLFPTGSNDLIAYIKGNPYLDISKPHEDFYKIKLLKGFSSHCSTVFETFFDEFFKINREQI